MSDICPGACTWASGSPGQLHVAQGSGVPGCHRAVMLPMDPHRTSRRGTSSSPRERGEKQEDWNGVGALLYPFIFPVLAFFVLRSSGPAGASALVSLCRPCHQRRVSSFHAFLSHLDSAAFCVPFCDTLIS